MGKDIKSIIAETIEEVMNTPYVVVGVSNRHVHLSQEDVNILFGKGHQLTPIKDLQPGQYACDETVLVHGKKGAPLKARVLGPVRPEPQVELSVTDGFAVGLKLPVSESGDLSKAQTIVLENPKNGAKVERKCAIAALRHIHLTPEFAAKHRLRDKQLVSLEFGGERGVIMKNVLLRVSDKFADEIHIDTDEANSGLIKNGDLAKIIP